MKDDQYKEVIEISKQLPAEMVLQLERSLKVFFEAQEIPYNIDTLKACREFGNIIHSGLPPVYGSVVAQMLLTLTRIIHETETGFITSQIQPNKDAPM